MAYAEYITAGNETRTIRDLNGQQMLATIEASTTASKAYAVGDYLILNDKIYKVTAAIASGGTITVGTNVTETKAAAELTELNRQLSDTKSAINADQNVENVIFNILSNTETSIPFVWENGHIDTSTGQNLSRDSNQRTIGFIPLFGKKVSVKSTNSSVACYVYEYDKDYGFLEYHTTTTTFISPQNQNTKFIRVSTYSNSVPQSDLHEAITGKWTNTDAISNNSIMGEIIDSCGKVNITISGESGLSTNTLMPVVSGRTYKLKNNTSNSVVLNVINQDGTFTVIDSVGAGTTYIYKPTNNFYGIRVYFVVTGNCVLTSVDNGVYRLVSDNTDDIEEIRDAIIDNGIVDEYIILQDTAKRALKIPNKNAFEIATLDGSVFETNTVTMYASDGTTVLNTWGLSSYSGNKRSITNNSGDGAYVQLTNVPSVGIKITVFTKKKQPEKIRLMQYNIGKFNYGNGGGLSEDVSTKIANYKRFLAEYQPNICGMEEYTQYIDSSSSYGSDATLFNDLYFFGNKEFDVELAVKSDYDYRYFTNFYIKDDNNETAGSFVEYYADIKNTEVVIVVGAIAAGKAAEVRAGGLENLLKKYASKTNVIILIDTNVISATEHTALVTTAEGYSYKVANGGYFGTFDTYNLNSEYYHKIDNVLVKGNIVLKNVIVPDVYADLSSDHYPMIADVELKI